ncbi:hypothetical protein C8R44DRAFT_774502 [Mycena epipterygia]|nr:hypothetical protein C8R44DRAFT_774502 [Mycena epipterygia]
MALFRLLASALSPIRNTTSTGPPWFIHSSSSSTTLPTPELHPAMPKISAGSSFLNPTNGARINLFTSKTTQSDRGVPDECRTCGRTDAADCTHVL